MDLTIGMKSAVQQATILSTLLYGKEACTVCGIAANKLDTYMM